MSGNSIWEKPFGSGKGSVDDFLNPTDEADAEAKEKTFTGFGQVELTAFMQQSRQLGSAHGRVDTSKEGFGPKKQTFTTSDGSANPLVDISEDQVKGFIASFTKRQDEVFGRRAQPGLSQSRLV